MANLYKLSQNTSVGYDTYDSCVVCAETEDAARRIHPSGDDGIWEETSGMDPVNAKMRYPFQEWAHLPSQVECAFIGTSDPSVTVGAVICASFKAG